MSFTGVSLARTNDEFIGLANWTEALGDPQVWSSLGNTAWFTVLSTIPLVAIAMGLAILVNLGLPGQWFWRLSFFMPFLLASTRSEEHTSELQSRGHLVCRLLLEKR